MKLSMQCDYALRALFTLVEHEGRGPIPVRELARRNDIPKKFLEHIMLELKEQGWVESLPGRHGGYALAKKSTELTMGRVVRHFDGVLAPIACVSLSHREVCSQESVCRFRRVLLDVRNQTAALIDRATLALVHAGRPVTEEELYSDRLMDGAGI